jgi:hypothetical protein
MPLTRDGIRLAGQCGLQLGLSGRHRCIERRGIDARQGRRQDRDLLRADRARVPHHE